MRVLFAVCVICLVGCGRDHAATKKMQEETEPLLISSKNGVQVWCVYDHFNHEKIYFTTPSGDVQWMTSGGEDAPDIKHQTTSGVKKK